MGDFPTTLDGLAKAGYERLGEGVCRGEDCGAEVIWFSTPNGKKIPLDSATLDFHPAECPNADDFR